MSSMMPLQQRARAIPTGWSITDDCSRNAEGRQRRHADANVDAQFGHQFGQHPVMRDSGVDGAIQPSVGPVIDRFWDDAPAESAMYGQVAEAAAAARTPPDPFAELGVDPNSSFFDFELGRAKEGPAPPGEGATQDAYYQGSRPPSGDPFAPPQYTDERPSLPQGDWGSGLEDLWPF